MELITKFSAFVRNLSKRILRSYNAEYKAHKFLEKGNITPAPRHPTFEKALNKLLKDSPPLKENFDELYTKNKELNEHLKKVYLTSTGPQETTQKKRPKLNKYLKPLETMYYEPKTAQEGYCTLTNVLEILTKFQDDSKYWSPGALATHYKINKQDIVNLLMYCSLFKKEQLDLLLQEPVQKPNEENEKVVMKFESLGPPNQNPPKEIEQKKD